MHKNRPKYLDLRKIKLPITGIVSLLHRLSGLLLFLAIPLLLLALADSLESENAFNQWVSGKNSLFLKAFFLICLWGLLHHLLSGLRLLALDLHIGMALPLARKTAWWALSGGLILAVLFGVYWW